MSRSTPNIVVEASQERAGNVIEVVAGVVSNAKGEVLVNQRSHPPEFVGKWEFPGGKIEAGETVDQALRRELMEEIHIKTISSEPLISISHDYTHAKVRLHVHKVTEYSGTPKGREGQRILWVAPGDLRSVDFLDANEPILNAVCLPNIYLITDTRRFGHDRTLQRLEAILKRKKCFVQMREKEMTTAAFEDFAGSLIQVCRKHGALALANTDPERARRLGFDGVHLSSTKLREMKARPGSERFWVGASCHDQSEINAAQQLKVDFAVVSPVLPTESHAHSYPMGWDKFAGYCSRARIPVYALGGVGFDDLKQAQSLGAQGVAMISDAWGGSV